MKTVKCRKCGTVSQSVRHFCPKCGTALHGVRLSKCVFWAFAIVFVFVCLCAALSDSQKQEGSIQSVEKPKQSYVEIRERKINEQFGWWGHWTLTEMIKMSMNDPKSFEHVKTTYIDCGDHLLVTTTFRGKNGFGGVVRQTVVAKVDLKENGDGNGMKIISVK